MFILCGAARIAYIRRTRRAFDEACDFAAAVKAAIRYSALPLDGIARLCDGERYSFFKNRGGSIVFEANTDAKLKNCTDRFISCLGTTDFEGQLDLCDDYIFKLDSMRRRLYDESGAGERVCAAVSALCVLCSVLLML